MHHSEQNKDVCDKNGREQLEKILNPKMHNPEAPEVCRREMLSGICKQADSVKGRN
jgi:hypothetical protein